MRLKRSYNHKDQQLHNHRYGRGRKRCCTYRHSDRYSKLDDNLFAAQTVQINLNDGRPVIREDEYIFEPGMTVKKNFFVRNESTCDVFYRLYFKNVSGGLANVLQVKICDGDKVLFEGTPAQLNRTNVAAADDLLHVNEKRNLQIYFHYPEEAGNDTQMQYLSFDFAADATQVRNNTNKEFE